MFALLGWTSFLWRTVREETPPETREGPGIVGIVAGSVGLGVGPVSGPIYGSPLWGYVIVGLSVIVIGGSLLLGGDS